MDGGREGGREEGGRSKLRFISISVKKIVDKYEVSNKYF